MSYNHLVEFPMFQPDKIVREKERQFVIDLAKGASVFLRCDWRDEFIELRTHGRENRRKFFDTILK